MATWFFLGVLQLFDHEQPYLVALVRLERLDDLDRDPVAEPVAQYKRHVVRIRAERIHLARALRPVLLGVLDEEQPASFQLIQPGSHSRLGLPTLVERICVDEITTADPFFLAVVEVPLY